MLPSGCVTALMSGCMLDSYARALVQALKLSMTTAIAHGRNRRAMGSIEVTHPPDRQLSEHPFLGCAAVACHCRPGAATVRSWR